MRMLLDTHILLWALYEPARLSRRAVEILSDEHTMPLYSHVSLWEVQIKHQKNPMIMPPSARDLHADCDEAGLGSLPIRPEHVFGLGDLHQLPGSREHRDPFDRMLLSQAKVEGIGFLTSDQALATYGEWYVSLA